MLFSTLGPLRIGLLLIALINLLVSAIHWIGNESFTTNIGDTSTGWEIAAVYIAPVNAPIILVVVLFDYIMSRVRAADASGEERANFMLIARIELDMIALYLAYWVPYFVSLLEI